MSANSLKLTMARIQLATEDSPIAVFKSNKPDSLESVFAATIRSREEATPDNPMYIGTYHGGCDLREVRAELKKHVLSY